MDATSTFFAVPLAAGGGLVFLLALVVIFVVVVFVLYTRRGSAVSQRPIGAERGDEPGVGEGSSRISASEHDVEESAERHRPR
jgi:hypothetical protein